MASETDAAARGYLYRALVDGARPFGYRGRVRALLGFPEPGGVQMNFPKPLTAAGLAYVRPHFTGEFEFPDELLAFSPQHAAHREPARIEETEPSIRPTRGLNDNSSWQQDPLIQDSELPRVAEVGTEKPGRADRQVRPAPLQAEDQRGNPLKRPDVVIPDVQGWTHRAAATDASRPRENEPTPARSQPEARLGPHSNIEEEPRSGGAGPSKSGSSGNPTRLAADGVPAHGASGSPRPPQSERSARLTSADSPLAALVSPPARPQTAAQELPPFEAPAALEFPPRPSEVKPSLVAPRAEARAWHRLPEPQSGDPGRPMRSVPATSWPDQPTSLRTTRRRPEARPQDPPDNSTSQAAAGPAPPPPIIVLHQPADVAASHAFWERRHLSHLSVRIRR
jgi:hypothetical protein